MKVKHASITDRKIKFALVGCGRIAQNHIGAIDTFSDEAELVDVCDVNLEAFANYPSLASVNKHTSYKSMLETSKADAVILTTPSGLHPKQAIEAASHNFDVITEKPMATRWQDGLDMVRACDDAGVRLFVVKQNRKNATLQLLKQAIDEKRFGRIYMVNINVFWTRPQDYYDSSDWRGTWEFDGGALMNQASHYIDLLDWMIGPVESLQAYTSTLARDIEVEDSAAISLRWRSGALGSMNVSMLTYPKNFEGSITILGEKGTVRVGGVAVNEIQHWEFQTPAEIDQEIKEANYETTSVYGFGHPLYYRNVLDVFQDKAQPETDGREGLKSLELLIGAYLSARDGKRVHFPLEY